jgi:inosine/xanthosine triphosphate pyrophosphatase family protein
MKNLILNTGNNNKLKEFIRLFAKYQISLRATCQDVPEICADLVTVVIHKASQIGEGVLVEDTSLEIDQASVGINIRWQLDDLPKYIGRKAVWRVLLAYQQKGRVYVYEGKISGQIVEPKGDRSFGFDPFFLPEGSKYTLGESKPDSFNARAKVVEAFVLKMPISVHAPLFDWKGSWQ